MRQLLTSILGLGTKRTPATLRRAQPRLEALEDRRLLTVGLSIDGFLVIDGGNQNDWAWVNPVTEHGINFFRTFGNVGNAPVDMWFETAKVKGIVFRGWGGNDDFAHGTTLPCWMLGGAGDDKLVGGFGTDTIYGETGNDYIKDQTETASANWDNWLFGGWGDDTIEGWNGNDQITGGEGNDTLYGGNGIDWMWGKAGNDQMDGGWGDDAMWGGVGNDTLAAFQGNDWLWGGDGSDKLYGDAGKDHFQYDPADIRDFSTSDGDEWWV